MKDKRTNATESKNPKSGTIAKKVRTKMNGSTIYFVGFIVLYLILFLLYKDKLLFTPDFGESDAYHLNLSYKYLLADSYKHNQLPFWTEKLQGGFPLVAEGQVGAFYLLNYIFLRFFPFVFGFNLLFITALFIFSIGAYFLLREWKVPSLLSFLLSLNATFNATIILRLVHLNVLQTISWMPLLFFCYLRFINTKNKLFAVCSSLIISQIIFAGHIPVAYLVILGFVSWFTGMFYFSYKKQFKLFFYNVLFLAITTIVGFCLTLPQLISMWELTKMSFRSVNLDFMSATSYSMIFKDFLTFINPYALGNPTLATYTKTLDQGIFWESTPYMGIVFFTLFIVSFVISLSRKILFKNKLLLLSIGLVFIYVLLALGRNSPVYFIFFYPPFNMFRTQARYLILVSFFIFIFTSLSLKNLFINSNKAKVVLYILLVINLADLVLFGANYHLFIAKDKVLAKPATVTKISNDYNYVTAGQPFIWNEEILYKLGWKNDKAVDLYLFMKNFLYPNSNLLFGKSVYEINTGGFVLKRQSILRGLIKNAYISTSDEDKYKLFITPRVHNLLNLLNIRYMVTPGIVSQDDFRRIAHVEKNKIPVNVYEVISLKHDITYVPETTTQFKYIEQFEKEIINNKSLVKNALVEDKAAVIVKNNPHIKLKSEVTNERYLKMNSQAQDKTFVVVKKNYYPSWKVLINEQEVKTYPVNVAHIGFFVPRGKSTIEVFYDISNIIRGLFIGIVVFIGYCFGLRKNKLQFMKTISP